MKESQNSFEVWSSRFSCIDGQIVGPRHGILNFFANGAENMESCPVEPCSTVEPHRLVAPLQHTVVSTPKGAMVGMPPAAMGQMGQMPTVIASAGQSNEFAGTLQDFFL